MTTSSSQHPAPVTAYLVLIFLTGATTLALELLASRVMTPYFGVSLYIWTGILSITLVALALGYYIGGKLTGSDGAHSSGELEFRFLVMPALSSLTMIFSCWLYPQVFADLASLSLVAGSFMACSLLIFLPLVAVSAMNPLLIAIDKLAGSATAGQGDSGSGRVFFVSTVGSVVGVSITAFLFIPNVSNFNSLLMLALTLAAFSLAGAFIPSGITRKRAGTLKLLGVTGIALSAVMLAMSSSYLKKSETISFRGNNWELKQEYSSLFGTTKVIQITGDWSNPGDGGEERYINLFLNDGTVMNTVDSFGRSLSPFTYALEFAALGLKQDATTALVLGLGAGVIPTRLAKQGIEVDVVEINPDYLAAAVTHFGFDPAVANLFEADARTFVRFCAQAYDVVVIDLFQADGVPDYLLTREFFQDIANCMAPDGVASFNTLASTQHMDAYYNIIRTIQSVFPEVLMFHGSPVADQSGLNIYLAASRTNLDWDFELPLEDLPSTMAPILRDALSSAQPLDQSLLARASVITDEYNVFSVLNNKPDQIHRQATLKSFPREFLVN